MFTMVKRCTSWYKCVQWSEIFSNFHLSISWILFRFVQRSGICEPTFWSTNAITVTIHSASRRNILRLGFNVHSQSANDTNLFLSPFLHGFVASNTAGNAGIFVGTNTCANLFTLIPLHS